VMGKGVALMFREAFPANYRAYRAACKAGALRPGGLFVHRMSDLVGPRLIVNFATKDHWRGKSRMEWIESGLARLAALVREEEVRSIALPPLGAGNGGLNWNEVRPRIDEHLGGLDGVRVIVFEPTDKYRNVSKRAGVEALTPARAASSRAGRAADPLSASASSTACRAAVPRARGFPVRCTPSGPRGGGPSQPGRKQSESIMPRGVTV